MAVGEKSLALLLPFDNGREIFYAYQFLIQLSFDNLLEMKRYAQAALKYAQAIDFRWGIVGGSELLSWALAEMEEYDEARRHLDHALTLCRNEHDLSGETWTYMHFAHIARCQQDYSEAKQFLLQALAIAETLNYRIAIVNHHLGLAEIALKRDCLDEALFHAHESLKLAQELGNQKHVTLALDQIRVIESLQPSSAAPLAAKASDNPLTERELEVLRLVAEGLSNREIAEQEVLAISTVKWYINEIFSKLHVTTRTQAVAHARTLGLLA
jgi:DNA-binding CsgD family transcriptional regulator